MISTADAKKNVKYQVYIKNKLLEEMDRLIELEQDAYYRDGKGIDVAATVRDCELMIARIAAELYLDMLKDKKHYKVLGLLTDSEWREIVYGTKDI